MRFGMKTFISASFLSFIQLVWFIVVLLNQHTFQISEEIKMVNINSIIAVSLYSVERPASNNLSDTFVQ